MIRLRTELTLKHFKIYLQTNLKMLMIRMWTEPTSEPFNSTPTQLKGMFRECKQNQCWNFVFLYTVSQLKAMLKQCQWLECEHRCTWSKHTVNNLIIFTLFKFDVFVFFISQEWKVDWLNEWLCWIHSQETLIGKFNFSLPLKIIKLGKGMNDLFTVRSKNNCKRVNIKNVNRTDIGTF